MNIEDIIDYIETIDESVREQILLVDKSERSIVLNVIISALLTSGQSLMRYHNKLQKAGEAPPMTDEQRAQLRAILGEAKILN